MEDEIRWKVSMVQGEVGGFGITINKERVGPDMTSTVAKNVIEFLRLAGQDIIDVVSRELGA